VVSSAAAPGGELGAAFSLEQCRMSPSWRYRMLTCGSTSRFRIRSKARAIR